MKIAAIANQKGGCGKTTTAINLAGALAYLGKNVLLIDLDPQAHASYGLGIVNQAPGKSIYNILTEEPDKKRALAECIVNVSKNLDLIPSNILLSTLEQELKDAEDAVSKLYQILSSNKLGYNYVIIDCPPSLGFLTFNALRAAEHIIVPIDMSAFSLMGVGKLLGMLELIKIKICHAPQVNALATLFDKRTKYSQTMFDEIKSFFRSQLLTTVIRMNVDLKKAVSTGTPVVAFNRESNGAQDYLALAQELLRADGALEFEKALESVSAAPAAPASAVMNTPRQVAESAPAAPQQSGPKEISFSITAPNARDIHLVGDFNHWKINDESRLARHDDGRWEKKMGLAPGRYKYKFVVDGEWLLDSGNQDREQNSFGTFDSILKI